jgi:hypothetical protein
MIDMTFNIVWLLLLFVLTASLGLYCIEQFRIWQRRQDREEKWFFEDLQDWLDEEAGKRDNLPERDEDKQC